MKIVGNSCSLSSFVRGPNAFELLSGEVERLGPPGSIPLRFALTEMTADDWRCELECVIPLDEKRLSKPPSIFAYRQRTHARTNQFNTVMLIPTGIDCNIGGHAGDATPAARVLAAVSDHLILHPNVVNASDINEMTENCLYVEGSQICQLLMGTAALRKVRNNRILVVTERREDGPWTVDQVVNTTSAARATLGADCSKVVVLKNGLSMLMTLSPAGRATGEIGGFGDLMNLLAQTRDSYDAIAISTKISPYMDSSTLHQRYFSEGGPNPWGGVEAALTHMVSTMFQVPSAHAPTMSDLNLRTLPFGQVEPRKAAEAISTSYLFCVLKGLQRAPAIIEHPTGAYDPSAIAAEDVSCLVIPDGTVGLPTLAALQQGIPVIAVRNNTNLMRNDLRRLPFAPGQLHIVDSYLEAAGLLAALRVGVHPAAVGRPMANTEVVEF